MYAFVLTFHTCEAMPPTPVEAKKAVRLWMATVQCGLPKEEWNRTSRLAFNVSWHQVVCVCVWLAVLMRSGQSFSERIILHMQISFHLATTRIMISSFYITGIVLS